MRADDSADYAASLPRLFLAAEDFQAAMMTAPLGARARSRCGRGDRTFPRYRAEAFPGFCCQHGFRAAAIRRPSAVMLQSDDFLE